MVLRIVKWIVKKRIRFDVMKYIVRWTEIKTEDTTDDRGLFHQEHEF
jgi:hypothetical protein